MFFLDSLPFFMFSSMELRVKGVLFGGVMGPSLF